MTERTPDPRTLEEITAQNLAAALAAATNTDAATSLRDSKVLQVGSALKAAAAPKRMVAPPIPMKSGYYAHEDQQTADRKAARSAAVRRVLRALKVTR